jgi:hypothetical protein
MVRVWIIMVSNQIRKARVVYIVAAAEQARDR